MPIRAKWYGVIILWVWANLFSGIGIRGKRILYVTDNCFRCYSFAKAWLFQVCAIFVTMKTLFVVVGKTIDKNLKRLIDDYAARVGHYIPFEIEVVPDLKNTKSLSPELQKQREGEALLKVFRPGDTIILLDEHGREFRSVDFAAHLQKLFQTSRRLLFVIGGPYGFSEAVYAMASAQLSISQMTFSHQMIRLLFVEQLYRALTIINGEPYHHE